jgi:hypothetical protein
MGFITLASGRRSTSPPAQDDSWLIVNAIGRITPTLIYPLAGAAANARHRRAPSAVPFSIPVVIQGGAWPFRYTLTTKPTDATIGEFLPTDWLTNGFGNYGEIQWANPTVGTHTFAGTVYDQLGAEVPFTFSLEVIDRENTTYFMFLDATNGTNSNNGSFSLPRQTIAGWYGPNKADTTHAQKQIFYRTGTYFSTAAPEFGGTGQQVAMTQFKPRVHVAYPGDTVVMDLANTAYYNWESVGAGDVWFSNFTFQNPTVSESGSVRKQFLRLTPSGDRAGIWRNRFIGNDDDSGNSSNSSAIMFDQGLSAICSNHFICQNIFDNLDNMDFVLCYGTNYFVFEGNEVVNGYTADEGWGAFLKARNVDFITVRANKGIDGITLPLLFFSSFTDQADELRDHIEACFNRYASTDTTTGSAGAGALGIGQSISGSTGNHYGVFYSFRNNWKHPHMGFVGVQAGTFSFEYDCIEHSGTFANSLYTLNSTVSPTFDNCAALTALYDSSLLLTGTPRTSYYGTHGCELAYQ